MLLTTAEDSYNVFRPNLEPDEEEEESALHSEAVSTTDQEESKVPVPKK